MGAHSSTLLKRVGRFFGGGSAALAAARKQQWGELSDPAREQFYWGAPGPYAAGEEQAEGQEEGGGQRGAAEAALPKGGRDAETGKVLEAPPSFNLLLLRALCVFAHHTVAGTLALLLKRYKGAHRSWEGTNAKGLATPLEAGRRGSNLQVEPHGDHPCC